MMLKYILIYIILSYILSLLLVMYMLKFKKDELFLIGKTKDDYKILMLLSVFFGFSPLMLPLTIFFYIKNSLKK